MLVLSFPDGHVEIVVEALAEKVAAKLWHTDWKLAQDSEGTPGRELVLSL